jgi:hypothetical protein
MGEFDLQPTLGGRGAFAGFTRATGAISRPASSTSMAPTSALASASASEGSAAAGPLTAGWIR